MFLIVPNRNPAKISDDNKKMEALIPNAGTANPDIRMNPKADPARSALYTAEDVADPSGFIVSSRKRFPVSTEGKNVEKIIKPTAGNPLFNASI